MITHDNSLPRDCAALVEGGELGVDDVVLSGAVLSVSNRNMLQVVLDRAF